MCYRKLGVSYTRYHPDTKNAFIKKYRNISEAGHDCFTRRKTPLRRLCRIPHSVSRHSIFLWKPGDENARPLFIGCKAWGFRHQFFRHGNPRNKKNRAGNGQRSDDGNPSPGYRQSQTINTPPHRDLTEVVGMSGISP